MAVETKTKIKNKSKNANKTKIFLANPFKPKCPSLEEDDLQLLKQLLTSRVEDSDEQTPTKFATSAHICLGLESSLRTINNGKAACVLLSSSIKPRYLLGLIARNVEVKDATVPTYCQVDLENLIQGIFGIKALALVLPKETTQLGADLSNWIQSHRKPVKLKVVEKSEPTIKPKKRKNSSFCEPSLKQAKLEAVKSDEVQKEVEPKSWGSSYISFSKGNIAEANVEEDEDKLLSALDRMAVKIKEQTVKPEQSSGEIENKVELDSAHSNNDDDNDDEFLGTYAPLTVHKICPNPNRKPKKKRKKKTKNNQNKR